MLGAGGRAHSSVPLHPRVWKPGCACHTCADTPVHAGVYSGGEPAFTCVHRRVCHTAELTGRLCTLMSTRVGMLAAMGLPEHRQLAAVDTQLGLCFCGCGSPCGRLVGLSRLLAQRPSPGWIGYRASPGRGCAPRRKASQGLRLGRSLPGGWPGWLGEGGRSV